MNAKTHSDCPVKAVAWDNEGVLSRPDWNRCYDLTYQRLGLRAPLSGDPSRGKHYKSMLSVPITQEINVTLKTFEEGYEESNYLQSYSSGHISCDEFWPIACVHGFHLEATAENLNVLREAHVHLLRDQRGQVEVFGGVVEVLASLAAVLPQFMLSNINPDAYEGLKDAEFLKMIPETRRFFSIFTKCRKPAAKMYQMLIARSRCEPHEVLFIDDKASNIEAAKSNGMQGILFDALKEPVSVLIGRLETLGIMVCD